MAKTIFYAEDEGPQREMVEMFLSGDYNVEAYDDGLPLYTALQQARPDLVITDGNMPRMRGYEVLKKARAEGYQGPAIIFSTPTSDRDDKDIEELRKQGVEYVPKPQIMQLMGLVKKLLGDDSTINQPTDTGR